MTAQQYILALRPIGDTPPAEIRLRGALKVLRRRFALECTGIVAGDSCPIRPRPAKVSKRPKTLRKSAVDQPCGALPPGSEIPAKKSRTTVYEPVACDNPAVREKASKGRQIVQNCAIACGADARMGRILPVGEL